MKKIRYFLSASHQSFVLSSDWCFIFSQSKKKKRNNCSLVGLKNNDKWRAWISSKTSMRFIINSLCLLLSLPVNADIKNSLGGIFDINFYPYLSEVDTDTTVTLNLSSQLGQRFSYFSLTNMGNKSGLKALQDINTFYTEQNLRWQVAENSPFDLTLQMNFRNGGNNDRHRLGVRWRLHNTDFLSKFLERISLNCAVNLHPVQFDSEEAYVWQIEHVFKLMFPYISDRLYVAGFLDHTFGQDLPFSFPSNPVVVEIQTGYLIFKNIHLISEYRRNDVNNFSAGLEYKKNW
jgi:hypothetical protein